jgi:CheY-like chemotaxis protein
MILMKPIRKFVLFPLWILTLILGGVLLCLPLFSQQDGLSFQISNLQHNGIYIRETVETPDQNLQSGDRVQRINACGIERYLRRDCPQPEAFRAPLTYTLTRNGTLITVQTYPVNRNPVAYGRSILPYLTGFFLMMICALAAIFALDIKRINNLLIVNLLLFALSFAYLPGRLPFWLLLYPTILWATLIILSIGFSAIFAVSMQLILGFPKDILSSKKINNVILALMLVVPPLVSGIILVRSSSLITGLNHAHRWQTTVGEISAIAFLVIYLIQVITKTFARTRIRLRWMRVAAVIILVSLASLASVALISNFETIISSLPTLRQLFAQGAKPAVMLLLCSPIMFAIPLTEKYPGRIDQLENRLLFYTVILLLLFSAYLSLNYLLFMVGVFSFWNTSSFFPGFAFVLLSLFVLASIRKPINRVLNQVFYRDRLHYQTFLPDYILQLSTNLNLSEILNLLLKTLPQQLKFRQTFVILRSIAGDYYYYPAENQEGVGNTLPLQHPMIQRLRATHKPILYYVDMHELHQGTVAFMKKNRIEVIVPLIHQKELVGVYLIGEKFSKKPFSITEVKVLSELSLWAGAAINNATIFIEKEDYSRSLEETVEQQSRELDRVVDETRRYQRSNHQHDQENVALIGEVNQDIREPLSKITTATQQLKTNIEKAEERKLIQQLENNTAILVDHINAFLDYTLIETGQMKLNKSEVNLNDVFAAVSQQLILLHPQAQRQFSFYLDALTPVICNLDSTRLIEILYILTHMSTHLHPNTHLAVSCHPLTPPNEPGQQMIQLGFECRHVPVSPDISIEKNQKDRQKIEHPALSLVIVKQLCKLFGGELTKEPSATTEGAIFRFSIHTQVPADTYPAYLAIDPPHLRGKSMLIISQNEQLGQKIKIQTSSWGMLSELMDLTDNHEDTLSSLGQFTLVLIDAVSVNLSDLKKRISKSGVESRFPKTIVIHPEKESPKFSERYQRVIPNAPRPEQLYNLLTQAYLFDSPLLPAPPSPEATSHPQKPDQFFLGKNKVLLVSKEKDNALASYLAQFNWEVVPFKENLTSLPEVVTEQKFTAVILELQHRDRRELDTIRSIRNQQKEEQRLFIAAISANPVLFPAMDVIKAGANKYLLKPYRFEELSTYLAQHMSRSISN